MHQIPIQKIALFIISGKELHFKWTSHFNMTVKEGFVSAPYGITFLSACRKSFKTEQKSTKNCNRSKNASVIELSSSEKRRRSNDLAIYQLLINEQSIMIIDWFDCLHVGLSYLLLRHLIHEGVNQSIMIIAWLSTCRFAYTQSPPRAPVGVCARDEQGREGVCTPKCFGHHFTFFLIEKEKK